MTAVCNSDRQCSYVAPSYLKSVHCRRLVPHRQTTRVFSISRCVARGSRGETFTDASVDVARFNVTWCQIPNVENKEMRKRSRSLLNSARTTWVNSDVRNPISPGIFARVVVLVRYKGGRGCEFRICCHETNREFIKFPPTQQFVPHCSGNHSKLTKLRKPKHQTSVPQGENSQVSTTQAIRNSTNIQSHCFAQNTFFPSTQYQMFKRNAKLS